MTCAWSTLGPVPQDALRSFFKFLKGHAFSDFRRTAVDFMKIKNNVTLSRPGFVFIYLFTFFLSSGAGVGGFFPPSIPS